MYDQIILGVLVVVAVAQIVHGYRVSNCEASLELAKREEGRRVIEAFKLGHMAGLEAAREATYGDSGNQESGEARLGPSDNH